MKAAAHRDDKHRRDQADADNGNPIGQKAPRQRRYKRGGIHDTIDSHDMVMIHRCMAMDPENTKAYLNGCEEMVATSERKRVEEKVNSWRESLAPVTTVSLHGINGSGAV